VGESICDALAVLIVRLESSTRPDSSLCWHPWDQSIGANKTHGLPADIARNSTSEAPFKRMPREGGWPYFNDHVERVLFPRGNKQGERWLCCPDDMRLEFAVGDREPTRTAHVDLLERLTSPLEGGCTYGLIHLSLMPSEQAGAPGTLKWAKAVSSLFHRSYEWSKLDLIRGDDRTSLAVWNPVRTLVESLFGDPDPHLERSLYTVLMAQYPSDHREDVERERDWRRALAKRWSEVKPPPDDPNEPESEGRQTTRVAGATSLLLRRTAVFTLSKNIDGKYARNLRSYWAESIVFGLLQQDSLEEFQRRLAAIGNPLDPEVQTLRRDWLKFRNVLWWSQLGSDAEVPQELLKRLRNELGTERLFTDLEGDLATYSEQQQAEALANLQIYGAPFVVFGALITAIGLFEMSERLTAILVGASLLFAICAMLFVRLKLKGKLIPRALGG